MKKLYYIKVIGKNEYVYKMYDGGSIKHTKKIENAQICYYEVINRLNTNKYELIEIKG